MRIIFFSPILIILMIIMSIKLWTLFHKIEAQSGYDFDSTTTSSVLIDNAYAVDQNVNNKTQQQYDSYLSTGEEQKVSDKGTKNISNVAQNQFLGDGKSLLQIPNFSSAELKLLQELSNRREELDKNQEELKIRTRILKATEAKLDQKMVELKELQVKLEELMTQYNQKESSKVMSLVKIYENMKPRDAAKIFDELEMPVLLKVVSNMKEIKVAPVIASMDIARARELSIELAKQKTISSTDD